MNDAMPVSAPILWLLVLLGYLLGSIPFGYLLVRARSGADVRAMGSGNIGAANVARTAGLSIGVATLVLDAAKGFFAVWLAGHFSDGYRLDCSRKPINTQGLNLLSRRTKAWTMGPRI